VLEQTFKLYISSNSVINAIIANTNTPIILKFGISIFFYLVCEAIGTAPTPGLLCLPRVIVKMMIVEKQMECRLTGEAEVLGENLP
jgi:hypothetical protein